MKKRFMFVSTVTYKQTYQTIFIDCDRKGETERQTSSN